MNINFTLVLQIASFLILLGLLTKFLYRPLMKYLDDRAAYIKDTTESVRQAEEKAKKYAEETHRALEMARGESVKIKKESRQIADRERRKIVEEAKKEARFLIEKAMKDLGREKEVILEKIKSDIASISVDIARKVLGREISSKDHNRIIEESISELENELSGRGN